MRKEKNIFLSVFIALLGYAYAVGCYAPPAPPEGQKPVSINLFLKFFMLDKMYSVDKD